MSRADMRGSKTAHYHWYRERKANGDVTYFAVTGGLKDAWCILGADREVGDVHGRQRMEGGEELRVEEQVCRGRLECV